MSSMLRESQERRIARTLFISVVIFPFHPSIQHIRQEVSCHSTLYFVVFLVKYIEPPCVEDTVKEPSMCAKRLGSEAMTRMSGDNITVVVAYLKDVSTAEVVTWERAF